MGLDDAQLAELAAACAAVSSTNCWCMMYDAAHVLGKYVRMEARQRERRPMGRDAG